MFIGARVLKTGIAVVLTMYLSTLFRIEPAIFAAISAVVNMQPSVHKSLRNAWEQIGVHLVSVILAIFLGLTLGTNPIVMGFGVILIILLCNRLGWSGGITLGVVSIVFVLGSPADQFLFHAGMRSLSIMLGLGMAIMVNRILLPPEHKERLFQELSLLFKDASNYFLDSIVTFLSSASLTEFVTQPPESLLQRLDSLMDLHEHARDEFTPRDNALLVERTIEICRGFIERGQKIGEMTDQRVKRRNAPDSPLQTEGVSTEYQAILDVMREGERTLGFWARKVSVGLTELHTPEKAKEDAAYWTAFDRAMDTWQRKVNGVFYLRAMMEIAVVATEMRWAGRRMRSLYDRGTFRNSEPLVKVDFSTK